MYKVCKNLDPNEGEADKESIAKCNNQDQGNSPGNNGSPDPVTGAYKFSEHCAPCNLQRDACMKSDRQCNKEDPFNFKVTKEGKVGGDCRWGMRLAGTFTNP
jgi:hypothetical protein